MFSNIDLQSKGYSIEDNMRFHVVNPDARDQYDKSLYLDAAKRVIFRNCMDKLEIDDEQLPNFNKNFYYHKGEMQQALQECYNERVELHFGHQTALKNGMYINFEHMKREFQNYESWLPMNRMQQQYSQGFDNEQVDEIVGRLKARQ